MKKILAITLALLGVYSLQAQKWVSTTPENRHVVLEEFTGIHCGYCPDGHKRANDLAAQNPGKVVLINIHAGGYAVPKTGEPDFRTTVGEEIDDAAGVTGYPAGSINRTLFGTNTTWAHSRGSWATNAATIMGMKSPVNIAVKASVDMVTRELTVEAELYYTDTFAGASNYLTIALLQNDVFGPQSDYGNFNPDNWVNGQYRHIHIFRQMITPGTWGEKIDTTSKGTYIYRKYTTTLPADIKGVPLQLHKLEVAAFVAEGQGNIYTGTHDVIDIDAAYKTDLSLKDMTVQPTDYCFNTLNPKVEVTNNMDNDVTSFEVTALLDGVAHTKTYNGTLKKGEKTTIDWGNIAYSAKGEYSVSISGFAKVKNGSTTLYDMDGSNDASSFGGIGFMKKAVGSFVESFDATLSDNRAFDKSVNSSFSQNIGSQTYYGALNTRGAVLFPLHANYNVNGLRGSFVFGEVDMTQITNPFLTFYYAYSDDAFGGTAPTIAVEVSDDCGANWTTVRTITCTETGQPSTHGNWYIPVSSEYMWVGTSLADYADKAVLVRVSVYPGTSGNALWLDEITLDAATSLPETVLNDFELNVYPNPVQGQATVEFGLSEASDIQMVVYNTLNQEVVNTNLGNFAAGINTASLDLTNLEAGMYFVTIKAGNKVSTQKIIKK